MDLPIPTCIPRSAFSFAYTQGCRDGPRPCQVDGTLLGVASVALLHHYYLENRCLTSCFLKHAILCAEAMLVMLMALHVYCHDIQAVERG